MPIILFSDPHIIGETIGGAEVQLWILATSFCKSGWSVHYITDAAVSERQREGVQIHSLSSLKPDQYRKKYYSTLASINPDIIYQRGRKSHTGLVGQYAKKTNTPFIFATSMDIDCQRYKELGRLFQHPKDFLRKLRILPHRYKQDVSTLDGMRQAAVILTQSELQKGLLWDNLALESRVFRNLHPVPEQGLTKMDHPKMVLWLASVKRWKRPELFFQLAESLRSYDCQFILAGRLVDCEPYESQLHDYSNKNPNFKYIKNVDLEKSNELIARASIFINTSEPFEGFPNTFIQSWLRNTVTLSLTVDPDQLIADNAFGFISGDITTMSAQTIELLKNDDLRCEMGKNAREFAVTHFGLSDGFPKIQRIAEDLIEST